MKDGNSKRWIEFILSSSSSSWSFGNETNLLIFSMKKKKKGQRGSMLVRIQKKGNKV